MRNLLYWLKTEVNMNKAQDFKQRAAENRQLSLGQIQYRKLIQDLEKVVAVGGTKGTFTKYTKWYYENIFPFKQGVASISDQDVDELYSAQEEVIKYLKADGFKLVEHDPDLPSILTIQDKDMADQIERIRRSVECEIDIIWDEEDSTDIQPAQQGGIILP